jgi:hypothetical protein
VGKLQDKVVASVPDTLKTNVVTTKNDIETWRSSNAENLATVKNDLEKKVTAIEKKAATETKKQGKPSASTRYIDRPWAYMQLFFLTMLAYLYSTPTLFYSCIVVFSFLVLRSATLRVIGYIRHRKAMRDMARKPKAPRV